MSEEYGPLEALLDYGQADMDGIIVTTSRQAIHEVADELTTLRAEVRELREALEMIRFNWAGHAEECASKFSYKCDCDWPRVKAQCDAALAKGEK